MSTPRLLLSSLLLTSLIAACGSGDDTPAGPDAGPLSCSEIGAPAGTIDSYPGNFAGSIQGGGADLSVASGVCTTEPDYYAPAGEDIVIALTDLTAGELYGVNLITDEDLAFYIVTGCDVAAAGPITGQCELFADQTLGDESGSFTAPASGTAYVVIDASNDPEAPATGDFFLEVIAAECIDDPDCSAPTPLCEDFVCVECRDSFECTTAGAPSCIDNACVAGTADCTGDDVRDAGSGDDGPAAATALTLPVGAAITSIDGAICNVPATEGDWYSVVVTAADSYGVALNYTAPVGHDLDVIMYTGAGELVALGFNGPNEPEGFAVSLTPGTYMLEVSMFDPENTAAAAAYTLTMFEAECETEFDCTTGAEPLCGPSGLCEAGTATCTSDDLAETAAGNSDDGPGGATLLAGGIGVAQTTSASICNVPGSEADFYRVDVVAAGEGLLVDLGWIDTTADLDVAVFDHEGTILGVSYWKNHEVLTLSYLPVGAYYVRVGLFSENDVTAAVPYTLAVTRQTVQTCVNASSCAAVHQTQVYRGACLGSGACDFIPAGEGAAGVPCDSADDCADELCSYVLFESDADKSVCTTECDATTLCGTGSACSVGLATNICLPTCAEPVHCGADINSSMLDADLPWDFFACTAGACDFQ